MQVISWIGAFTALLAALIAVQQNDIKRILAYSTLSQLGYMVMSVGLAAPTEAMFHLATHAFFKALLFLAAGSIIVALHHEQDIWQMGGLRKKMPVTFWTFLAGTLALAGMWPLSGFYSKDSILAAAAARNPSLFVIGLLVAVLTTFYMFRLFFVVFTGKPKSDTAGHAVEAPGVMAWPLRILATLSVIGGLIGLEQLLAQHFGAEPASAPATFLAKLIFPFTHSLLGFLAAQLIYSLAAKDWLTEKLGPLASAMQQRFYFDEIYQATVIRFHEMLASVAQWVERWLVAGLAVRGTHGTTEIIGRALRLMQTGSLQMYALLLVLGAAFLLWFALTR